MLKRALVVLAFASPSLAHAASDRMGPAGIQTAASPQPPPKKPLAAIEALLHELADAGAAQASLGDVVAQQLGHLQATPPSPLLRR